LIGKANPPSPLPNLIASMLSSKQSPAVVYIARTIVDRPGPDQFTRQSHSTTLYYTTLGADPTNADTVYAGAEGFFKSIDGGKTFSTLRTPHGDNHDIWINPKDGQIMIQSNDGGQMCQLTAVAHGQAR
jgi:hypothetical protein